MMVIFVSQCEKKSLARTRRVLDSFADRIGDNTWQTIITQEGLSAVKKLLKKTASKNTAVSCHWLRSRSRRDLLWVVGNTRKFNSRGIVPVNRTQKDMLGKEGDWIFADMIHTVSAIAALFHDIGKSNIGFQDKLRKKGPIGDPYRHEWISLLLFYALVSDCKTDRAWLERMKNLGAYLAEKDKESFFDENRDSVNLEVLPPLASWVGWLIVTHHRMPFYYASGKGEKLKKAREGRRIKFLLNDFYASLEAVDHWVKNPRQYEKLGRDDLEKYFSFDSFIIHSRNWQKEVSRWANKALKSSFLMDYLKDKESISNTLFLYLSRLSLMVGDHNYSSFTEGSPQRLRFKESFENLMANTDGKGHKKQGLEEHLLGVRKFTSNFSRVLPRLKDDLPSLKNCKSLEKDAPRKFSWQNKAYTLARKLSDSSLEKGFFGVNMASTGCGKTIANTRIMYGISSPEKGARFTIALGLRVLTLQTGKSLRQDMGLLDEELTTLVGGLASKELYDLKSVDDKEDFNLDGSESLSELFSGDIDISEKFYGDKLGVVIENEKAHSLLFSPVVSCTIDHIIQASECKRGGRFIIPLLRLFTSDIIFDEPDEFSQEDLPALTRLVHLVGLLGSRILLSSATLTPDLIIGLYEAYESGRKIWLKSHCKPYEGITCAWFDEFYSQGNEVINKGEYGEFHEKFVQKRVKKLKTAVVRRKGEVLEIKSSWNFDKREKFFIPFAKEILDGARSLHLKHHIKNENNKAVSFGLIRFAHIKNINSLIKGLENTQLDENFDDIHIHLCCYHSRQLLILRSELEAELDKVLKRDPSNPEGIFEHEKVKDALKKSNASHHIFIILASPVSEVGRDHDYDWAIVEPSSMRSIIQLAGRVWRHRQEKEAKESNIFILEKNIKSLQESPIAFTRPGFESKDFPIFSHSVNEIIPSKELENINSIPRIICKKISEGKKSKSLTELEHKVMKDMLNNKKINYVNAYWRSEDSANKVNVHLQILSPFRRKYGVDHDYVLIPQDDSYQAYYLEDIRKNGLLRSKTQNQLIKYQPFELAHPKISPWLKNSLYESLEKIKTKKSEYSIEDLAIRYSQVKLPEKDHHLWCFNEWLGFWEE